MKATLTMILNALASLNPVFASILALVGAVTAAFTYLNGVWDHLFTHIDTLIKPTFGSINLSPCGLLNYVFPMDTFLTFLGAYITLMLLCALIRIVKSFIPMIN